MKSTQDLSESPLADAWAELQAHSNQGYALNPDAYRLAFADPEFLLRRETRGLRMQLEMLKPESDQQAQGIENTIVVFGSARFPAPEQANEALAAAKKSGDAAAIVLAERHVRNSKYYDQARLFSRLVAAHSKASSPQEQLFICTGGGPGIMEAANRGASEAHGINVGLNISLPHEQFDNPYITRGLSVPFHYFFMRKFWFYYLAKAVIVFPGGYGTLDELFELLTLVQTHKMTKPMPIVLFGNEYWREVVNFDALVKHGMIEAADVALVHRTDSVDDAYNFVVSHLKQDAIGRPGPTM